MGRLIDYSDVVGRYEELSKAAGSTDMDAAFIQPAEVQIEGRLSSKFTSPFSSNNLTAKDLCIDEVYYKMMLTRQPKKAAEMRKAIDGRIERLLMGESMVTNSGDIIAGEASVGFITTSGYHPTFGMGDTLDFYVSSAQVSEEEDARD